MRTRSATGDCGLAGVSDYGRMRLLSYADSFRELARSMEDGIGEQEQEGDREQILESGKLWENRQLLCGNLNEMAQIMDKVASEVFRLCPMEEKKRKAIVHGFKLEGIAAEDIHYIDRPGAPLSVGITLHTQRDDECSCEQAADMLSVLMNRRMEASVASPYRIDREKRGFVFMEEASYVVLSGVARAVRENESVSGDNYALIQAEKGRLTTFLSDGMGSGEKASKDSEWILDLMEKMIETGYSLEGALRLINNALLSRPEKQNMSTLDVCDLDLYQGSCSFYKIGAAASFLKRGNHVEQIENPSLPMGIFPIEAAASACRKLSDGDYIIMMTDGVLDALGQNRYEDTMSRIIQSVQEQNPKEIAKKILQFVLHLSGGHIADDMTVLVLGIWENT